MMQEMDWTPNPSNPALASVLPGDLISGKPDSRNVKSRYRFCKKCEKGHWREFNNRAEAGLDEACPEPCPFCGAPFGERRFLTAGWTNTPMASDFNPKTAVVPQHLLPPSLAGQRVR